MCMTDLINEKYLVDQWLDFISLIKEPQRNSDAIKLAIKTLEANPEYLKSTSLDDIDLITKYKE